MYARIRNHPIEKDSLLKSTALVITIALGVSLALTFIVIGGCFFVHSREKRIEKGLYSKSEDLLGRKGIEKEIENLQSDNGLNKDSTDLLKKYSNIRNSIMGLQKFKGQDEKSVVDKKVEYLEQLECVFTQPEGYTKAKSEKEYYQIIQDIDKKIRSLKRTPEIKCSDKKVVKEIKKAQAAAAAGKVDTVPAAGGIQPSSPGQRTMI